MPHSEFFCQACNRPFWKTLNPVENNEDKLSIHAVAAKKSSRDGSSWSPPSRVRKQLDKFQPALKHGCFSGRRSDGRLDRR